MDWKQIKREYIAGGTSYRKLCDKYGVPLSNLTRVAQREGWVELRQQCKDKSATKIVEIESDKNAERMRKLLNVADELLDVVEKAVQEMKTGELALDRTALTSLSSTMKDIKDIQSIKSKLDIEEQKARIAILKKQAESDDSHVNEVAVVIAGGDASWQK